jgi:tetratricopeptide (TPR) repeat protein
VHLTPKGHADLPHRLNNLGNSFLSRFERTGDLSDLVKAISAQQSAVHLTPKGHPALLSQLSSLGNSFQHRFEHTGDVSDLVEAVLVQQKAVDLMPEGHAGLPAVLNNLGNSFQICFEHTGDLSDLAKAVSVLQKAVHLSPEGHATLPGYLNNLGNSFQRRFERTGDLSDLSEAISVRQRAVHLAPDGHAHLPAFLNNLGVSFQSSFEHTGNLCNLAEAVSAKQRAVCLTPAGHLSLPGRLNNLGNSLRCRFKHTGDPSDLVEAISVTQRAVELTPQGNPNLPTFLDNLGVLFQRRFDRTGDQLDLAEAVSAMQRAVALTPEGHPNLPGHLYNLGQSQHTLFQSKGRHEDLNDAISTFKLSATRTSGPPRVKFEAARKWARLLNLHHPDHPSEILLAFDTALRQVTLIAGLEQTIQGRHSQIDNVSNIALEAASSACSLGRPDKALEWLEQGRCLVWNQLNHLRTPLDDLGIHHAELAARVRDVAKQLEIAGSSRRLSDATMHMTEKMSLEAEAAAHLRLAREWDELLQQVRAIPDFDSFLQPSPCSALLQHLPSSGAIVVINIDDKRCDAIALIAGRNEPLHIPLSRFSQGKAQGYRRALAEQLKPGFSRVREEDEGLDRTLRQVVRPRKDVRDILQALWICVVKPILDALAYSVSALSCNHFRFLTRCNRKSKAILYREGPGYGGVQRVPYHSSPSTRRANTKVLIPRVS